MSAFRLFKGLNKTVDPEEVKALTTKLLEYDKLSMPQMTEKLCQLDYNYPKPFGIAEFFKSKYFIIGVVVAIVLLLVGVGLACWKFQTFRMFCFSFCRHKEKGQKSLPVPQPRLPRSASTAEGGTLRKRSSSASSSSSPTESVGKNQRPPPAFGCVSIHRSGQTSVHSSDSDTSRAVLDPLDLTAHYSTLPKTQPLFQRTPSERIHLAETDHAHLEALEKFSTLADIKLKERERQHYSSAHSAQL